MIWFVTVIDSFNSAFALMHYIVFLRLKSGMVVFCQFRSTDTLTATQ